MQYLRLVLSIFLLTPFAVSAQDLTDAHAYFGGTSVVSDSAESDSAPVVLRMKKKKKTKNTIGTYSGTFVLQRSRSFNGATCNPTQSFPAAFQVTGAKKKPTGQLGNVPITFSGKANKKGAKLRGTFESNGTNRKYVMLLRKVKSASAKLTFTETIRIGNVKACVFKHSATFARS